MFWYCMAKPVPSFLKCSLFQGQKTPFLGGKLWVVCVVFLPQNPRRCLIRVGVGIVFVKNRSKVQLRWHWLPQHWLPSLWHETQTVSWRRQRAGKGGRAGGKGWTKSHLFGPSGHWRIFGRLDLMYFLSVETSVANHTYHHIPAPLQGVPTKPYDTL